MPEKTNIFFVFQCFLYFIYAAKNNKVSIINGKKSPRFISKNIVKIIYENMIAFFILNKFSLRNVFMN